MLLENLLLPGNNAVDAETVRSLLKEFAAAPVYRSAAVEELILEDDYFRRPLRPEDLEFIDFSTPLDRSLASSLSALATHRMLLCIHDAQSIRLPRDGQKWSAFLDFYSDRNRILGEIVRPFLEHHAFDRLEQTTVPTAIDFDAAAARIMETRAQRLETEARMGGLASSPPNAKEKRRMQLVQFFGLADERRRALEAIAGGWLSEVSGAAAAARALLDSVPAADETRVADEIGCPIHSHACWQFYLPGSLAMANLLHYLASRGRNALRSLGALMFAVVAADAFLRQNAQSFIDGSAPALTPDKLRALFRDLVAPIAERWGESVWSEVSAGFQLCAAAQAIADEDLTRQLSWISGIERYKKLAQTIQAKIDNERIAIDRETFEEPREMCSTTHVHDDQRLVVIESGEMVFWGAPGMRVHLAPGEMILVPRQRLHGSSVMSDICVYHQPIIPEEWIGALVGSAATQS
ncbi:MAG TPA: hypothetical protein VIX89_00210 [Bryobacteraceae bacterium]